MRVSPEEVGKIRAALFEAKTQLKEMDNTVKLCDTVMDLYRELAESQSMTLRWKKAVEGLTPSGSEFVDDPERCAAHIRKRCQYPPIIIRLKEELAESQSRVASAFEAAAEHKCCGESLPEVRCTCGWIADLSVHSPFIETQWVEHIRSLTPRAADLNMRLKVARARLEELRDSLKWCASTHTFLREREIAALVAQLEAELAQEVGK